MTTISSLKLTAAAFATIALASTAAAQDESEAKWTGEGSLSAGTTSGNTDTTDLGLGVNLGREFGAWKVGVNASADYGETDGSETKNRLFFGSNLDRQINDKLFGFGQLSYEKDEFSGFASRTFIGGGLGYQIFDNEKVGWNVRGGPGIKIDEIEAILDTSTVPATILTPAMTEESFGATATSNWRYQFNDNVGLTNDTDILYAETSTQIGNSLALTATLTDTLSARLSFDVRHDTNPPLGFEDTDTATRISLVYGFGK